MTEQSNMTNSLQAFLADFQALIQRVQFLERELLRERTHRPKVIELHPDALLSRKEAMRFIKRGSTTFTQLVKRGEIPVADRNGVRQLFRRTDLINYLKQRSLAA